MELEVLRRLIVAWLRSPKQFSSRQLPRDCSICKYHGIFLPAGHPPRWNARCPACGSRERHRLSHLLYQEIDLFDRKDLRILHFAPEPYMLPLMKEHAHYETTDPKIEGTTRADDIRAIASKNENFDVVIAHHVLEHIDDDRKALAEIWRVLVPGGQAILSAPINWSRSGTFESDKFNTRAARAAAYGGADHVRYYGRDFPERIRTAGFTVREFRAEPEQEVMLGLGRDEAIYVATKTS